MTHTILIFSKEISNPPTNSDKKKRRSDFSSGFKLKPIIICHLVFIVKVMWKYCECNTALNIKNTLYYAIINDSHAFIIRHSQYIRYHIDKQK